MRETRSTVVSVGDGLELRFERTRLLVEAGPDQGRELLLVDRPVVVGRGEEADLRLGDATVSRAHLAIEPWGAGYRVRDLGSKGGTFVNGVQVTEAPLPPEARLRLGVTELLLRSDAHRLKGATSPAGEVEGQLGASLAMRRLFGLVRRVGELGMPVLVTGASGTGKEGLARAVHRCGPDRDGPYEVVDCTLLEREHLRSELFGHVKGAFTGADAARMGAFERADGGTLFLDEVGELPLDLQPALLRVLELGEVRPLGADRAKRVRTRVVSATNRDLPRMVAEGRFREDLYFRLSAVVLELPPLADREDDAVMLARHFCPPGVELGEDALAAIRGYRWPGNVRELRFRIQRAAGLASGSRLSAADLALPPGGGVVASLPVGPRSEEEEEARSPGAAGSTLPGGGPGGPGGQVGPGGGTMADYEEAAIREALRLYDGNKKEAAQHLGIGRSTLYRKLALYGLE